MPQPRLAQARATRGRCHTRLGIPHITGACVPCFCCHSLFSFFRPPPLPAVRQRNRVWVGGGAQGHSTASLIDVYKVNLLGRRFVPTIVVLVQSHVNRHLQRFMIFPRRFSLSVSALLPDVALQPHTRAGCGREVWRGGGGEAKFVP